MSSNKPDFTVTFSKYSTIGFNMSFFDLDICVEEEQQVTPFWYYGAGSSLKKAFYFAYRNYRRYYNWPNAKGRPQDIKRKWRAKP